VVLGRGHKVVGFMPEAGLPEDLEKLRSVDPVAAELVARAMRNLPQLKTDDASMLSAWPPSSSNSSVCTRGN
jgi:hypothetical protein